MKKFFVSVILAASLAGIISMPQKVYAADFNAGIYSYYTWWNPSWRSVYSNVENDPMLIWGPYLAVTFFEKLSFSALLLQNRTNMSDSFYTLEGNGSYGPYTIDIDTTIDRNEIDITSGYKFTPRFSVFLGCKFLFYNLGQNGDNKLTFDPATYTSYDDSGQTSRTNSIGAAIGASYSIPLYGNLFFTLGNTIVYFSSSFDLVSNYQESPGYIAIQSISYDYISLGDNATGTFSYYVPSLSTIFSVGGRFQVLKHFSDGDAPSLANDYFYGITLTAILQI